MVTADILLYKNGETGPSGESGLFLYAAPLSAQFKVSVTSGIPTAFHWDFGDGGISDVREPYHTFSSYGRHRIVLTTTDSVGTDIFIFDLILGKLDFYADVVRGLSPLTVRFEDQSVAPLGCHFTGAVWNFGDGLTGMAPSISHVYTENGKYNVSLSALFTDV